MTPAIQNALEQALHEAKRYVGATAPNPPVGAAALDETGEILSVQAHHRAGTFHAEARVIDDLAQRQLLDRLHTMVVTLEPCNHTGRTGPCSDAILRTPARKVYFGARDPNPRVQGRGAERLRGAGLEVVDLEDSACAELIAPFAHWSRTGLPWVTVKTAHDRTGSMIPPKGKKTFTSPASLRLAHELRKRADAIVTGSGTILADQPEFTVRHVPDHPGKQRWLSVLDRRKRVPASWFRAAQERGFRVTDSGIQNLEEVLRYLGSQGVVEALVEAGPHLSESVLSSGLWMRHVVIRQAADPSEPDHVEIRENNGCGTREE